MDLVVPRRVGTSLSEAALRASGRTTKEWVVKTGALIGVAACAVVCCSVSFGQTAFENYGAPFGSVTLPAVGAGSFGVVADDLADGRLIAVTGLEIFVETSAGSGAFAVAATIDGPLVGGSTDPAFVRVSPEGERVAIGAGFMKPVVIFDAALLDAAAPPTLGAANTKAFGVDHFDAAWRDEQTLAISASGVVTLLDATSDPAAPVNPVALTMGDAASAGVAFDEEGRLYTGNGFDLAAGGTETGFIKAFEMSELPADFIADGALIADVLTATPLDFDCEGNLLVGGGDVFGGSGDFGYFGIVNADVVERALGGGAPADSSDPTELKRLDPEGSASVVYSFVYAQGARTLALFDGVDGFTTESEVFADVNGDCVVDAIDLALLLGAWETALEVADLNASGLVESEDLALLLGAWSD